MNMSVLLVPICPTPTPVLPVCLLTHPNLCSLQAGFGQGRYTDQKVRKEKTRVPLLTSLPPSQTDRNAGMVLTRLQPHSLMNPMAEKEKVCAAASLETTQFHKHHSIKLSNRPFELPFISS